jgi:hypothetical protein
MLFFTFQKIHHWSILSDEEKHCDLPVLALLAMGTGKPVQHWRYPMANAWV